MLPESSEIGLPHPSFAFFAKEGGDFDFNRASYSPIVL